MGIDSYFLTMVNKDKLYTDKPNDKNNTEKKENKTKDIISPKTRIIQRNKSMENFIKFSWPWTF